MRLRWDRGDRMRLGKVPKGPQLLDLQIEEVQP